MKKYNSAPLPFMGQKRRFLNEFKTALKDYPKNAIYVDLFGGSGLLSHTVKALYPDAKVVYNDFDNYRERLENISKTNVLIADLRIILKDWPKDKQITGDARDKVIARIEAEAMVGYIDYITLSSSIMFSMKYATSLKQIKTSSLYNCIRQTEYNADGYLERLEVVQKDYKTLFDQYKNAENVVFLADPPYLSTEAGTYKSYWKLRDYLDVLQVLDNTNYFYFTSNKSSIIELCEWVETKTPLSNPFAGASKVELNAQLNNVATYTDIMLHKQWYTTTT
ncbi:DNA adenine methylase [Flavobacterium aestivum]|uniref:DNA adenine methylase n=1 Tax=Flavobacterium aestivum TaxID=3003257 RepID=UPI0024824F0A|nr:DNA adenine methylase [Flavobacterium aestivum]